MSSSYDNDDGRDTRGYKANRRPPTPRFKIQTSSSTSHHSSLMVEAIVCTPCLITYQTA
jgi:hypothetical protein